MYAYQIFEANDDSNIRVNKARESFGHPGEACYVLYHDGQMQMIQFACYEPYPGGALEKSAQNHIAALEAEQGE